MADLFVCDVIAASMIVNYLCCDMQERVETFAYLMMHYIEYFNLFEYV